MSTTSRPRLAAGVAAAATALLVLAGTGLAAAAVTTGTGSAHPAAPPTDVETSTSSPLPCGATRTPLPSGTVVQAETFDAGKRSTAWEFGDGQTAQVVADAARQGPFGLRVDGVQYKPLAYVVGATSTPGTYRVQLWLRSSPSVAAYLRPYLDVLVSDSSTGERLATQFLTLGPDWTQVTLLVAPRVRQDACDSAPVAVPFVVSLRSSAPGCGTLPALSLDIDDVAVTYAGTDTPTSSAAAPGRVAPACVVPTFTTTTAKPTTSAPAKAQCRVRVTRVMTWPGGSQWRLLLTNLTGAPMTGWHLRASVPAGETVAYAWPGAVVQQGTDLTLSADGEYADPLMPRKATEFGMVVSGGSTPPTTWTLDGLACKAG